MKYLWPRTLPCAFLLALVACGEAPAPEGAATDASAGSAGVADPWPRVSSPPVPAATEAFVTELLGRMTLEEKVGQVIQGELRSVTPGDVRRYHLGSVLNGGGSTPGNDKHASVDDWLAVADDFYDASMDTADGGQAIPIIWGSDAVHGHSNVYGATIFPHNIGLGAANDPALLRGIGAVTAIEMLTTGLDWTFAPTIAVVRDDRWGRTYEGYSEDPRIVARYAPAMVEGLQGVYGSDEFLGDDKIVATAKHYLGDGGTVGGRDQGDNVDDEVALVRNHAAGYPPAVAAGVRSVMTSFSSWHGEKLHGHEYLVDTALKDYLGFNGFVVGDWNGHGQVQGCSNASCPESLNAGVDMFMVPEDFRALYDNTLAQVRDGTISEARLDEAVRRILRVKHQAGLFDRGRPSSRPHAGNADNLGAPAHRELARRAVRQSLVLLKNAGGLLPLAPDSSVLVAGDGADDIGKQTGGWTLTWQGTGNTKDDFPGASSIWDGIREAVDAAGGQAVLDPAGRYASRPDVAIVVFGEDPYAEFQGDKPDVLYEDADGPDLALLERLAGDGIPVVAVFLSGRPLWVNPHLNAADAFIAAWLPGSEGAGVADLLFTAADGSMPYDFTGRLSYSWPARADQTAVNVGDAGYAPLFPYGHGLSFADDGDLEPLPETSGLEESGSAPAGTWYANGRALSGFSARIGDGLDSLARVEGLEMAGPELSPSLLMTDREVQGDASQLVWRDEKPGYFAIVSDGEPLDLRRESNGQLSLSLLLRVAGAPDAPLAAGMRDASGRLTEIPLDALLATDGAWHRYRIALRCFAERGADMGAITSPLVLHTSDEATIGIAEVRLATAAEGDAWCPDD